MLNLVGSEPIFCIISLMVLAPRLLNLWVPEAHVSGTC
jgi:hypothetical protein